MDKKNISVYGISKKFKNRLRIGTCSWNYSEWQEIGIYSAKQVRHYDYLPEYAEHFNTVEVDQWFWSLESPETVSSEFNNLDPLLQTGGKRVCRETQSAFPEQETDEFLPEGT
jgi:hypothetical protein